MEIYTIWNTLTTNTRAQYEQNLWKLVTRLKSTGATSIWCSASTVPENSSPPRKDTELLKFKAVAQRIARRNGAWNSGGNSFAKGRPESIQRSNDVDVTAEGSTVLAKQVAKSRSDVLK